MDVRLQEFDRIVVEYHNKVVVGVAEKIDCVIAYEDVADVYIVLWKRPEDEAWQLMWRADWDGATKYFIGFVGDLEVEYAHNVAQAAIKKVEEATA